MSRTLEQGRTVVRRRSADTPVAPAADVPPPTTQSSDDDETRSPVLLRLPDLTTAIKEPNPVETRVDAPEDTTQTKSSDSRRSRSRVSRQPSIDLAELWQGARSKVITIGVGICVLVLAFVFFNRDPAGDGTESNKKAAEAMKELEQIKPPAELPKDIQRAHAEQAEPLKKDGDAGAGGSKEFWPHAHPQRNEQPPQKLPTFRIEKRLSVPESSQSPSTGPVLNGPGKTSVGSSSTTLDGQRKPLSLDYRQSMHHRSGVPR